MFTKTVIAKTIIAFVFVIVATLFIAPAPAEGSSSGILVGVMYDKDIFYGPGGLPNVIDIYIDTFDGVRWTLRCRRANANLGLCENIGTTFYRFKGIFSTNFVLELEQVVIFTSTSEPACN